MISRKIWKELQNFRSKNGKEALLLDGARQVGKTYIVRRFAEQHYKNFIELNFIKNPAAKTLFEGVWDEKEFFVKLSAPTTGFREPLSTRRATRSRMGPLPIFRSMR